MLKWSLIDPVTLDTLRFEVSPNSMESPMPVQGVVMHPAALNGKMRGFKLNEPHVWQFSGILYTKTEYSDLRDWVQTRNQCVLTDHLNRDFIVRLNAFTPTREPWHHYPWRHRYTISATTYQGPM